MSKTRPGLSVVVVAKNEADRIGKLLSSVTFADEILVVDSGSTDGTPELCERMGAKVVFEPWRGYVHQKQFALDLASGEWILCLDADEALSEDLSTEIQTALPNTHSDVAAFSMPRLSRYLGRWIRHGGWYPDRKVRLFRRGIGAWEGEDPHDYLSVDGRIERLSHPILHYVYRNITDQVATINHFSDIYSSRHRQIGGWFVLAGLAHSFSKFIECYLLKFGFLDGLAGLVIAINSSWYVFLKHAKRWELGLGQGDSHGE